MNTQKDKIEQRKLRNGKYAIEDFRDAIELMLNVSIGHAVLVFVLGISFFLGSSNIINMVFCVLTSALLLGLRSQLKFIDKAEIYFGLGLYFFLFILEFIVGGIPETLIPFLDLNIESKRGGVVNLLNGLTPYIYLGLRLLLGFVFLKISFKRNDLEKVPKEILEKLNFQLEMK